VEADVFSFLYGRRLVLAPCISLVEHKSSFVNEFFGMLRGWSLSQIDVVSTAMRPTILSGKVKTRTVATSPSLTDANAGGVPRC
jgi:hypothetical protein